MCQRERDDFDLLACILVRVGTELNIETVPVPVLANRALSLKATTRALRPRARAFGRAIDSQNVQCEHAEPKEGVRIILQL